MLKSFAEFLKSLPLTFWQFFGIFLGISSITTPLSLCYLFVNSGSFDYKTAGTEISLKGKELQLNLKKLEEQIEYQNQTILNLTEAAKEKKVEQKIKPQLKEAEKAIIESSIRLGDVQSTQEELNNYVEGNIAPN